jgi:hypothetical protein
MAYANIHLEPTPTNSMIYCDIFLPLSLLPFSLSLLSDGIKGMYVCGIKDSRYTVTSRSC